MGNASRRRKPYMVRITTGYEINEKTGKSVQKYGIIGYARTREEGLQMLAHYHDQPFNLEVGNLTFREIYDAWSSVKYENASRSSITGYRAAYNAIPVLYEKSFRDLKASDLQKAIDTCGKNYPTLKNIKILFSQLYYYAMKNDLCSKDYSKYVDINQYKDKNPNQEDRKPFTKKEIDTFWSLSSDKYYQMILILIYTRLRIEEFLQLKKEHIHFDEQYFDIVKSKTPDGIRKVPISKYILPFMKNWYESSEIDYLFHTEKQKRFKYSNYTVSYFTPIMEQFGLTQTPHCCRNTFISLLAESNISQTFNKLIVGHKGAMSLNEKVYTRIDMNILIDAVNSIYYPDFIKDEEQFSL